MRLRCWLFLLWSLLLPAQKPGGFDPVASVALAFRDGAVVVEAPAGAHLKRAFLAVKLRDGVPGRLEVGSLPPPNGQDELGDGIWHGPVKVPVKGQGLDGQVELVVTYQPCTEGVGGVCYPPIDRVLAVSAADLQAPGHRGLPWTFLWVFAAGLLASLTPCVYPMIPIIVAVIGAKGGGRLRGLLLSLTLVLGMATTYTVLGVVAARSGAAFGAFAQRPAFLVPLSLLLAVFALSLLGLYEFRLPGPLQQKLQGGTRSGFPGAFLMGLVLGPISAPCVGPVVGTVLLAIAAQGQVLLGGAQLFVFALGMGVLFVTVGTFSASLPRSGAWLTVLKQAMGLAALGFAVWTLRFVVPAWLMWVLWAAVALAAAAVLHALPVVQGLRLRRGLALAALGVALVLAVRALESGLDIRLLPRRGAAVQEAWRRDWLEQDYEGALARARAARKVVVIDVWAEWCAQCKELDEKTWPDPRIGAWLQQHAVPVRIDTDQVRKDLVRPLGIVGYPTVLVLDGEGRILRRQEGFQEPEAMLAFLEGR